MSAARLTSLLEAYVDGRLTAQDAAELERLLLASESARRQFWEETALHGLTLEAAQLKWSAPPAVAPRSRQSVAEILGALFRPCWRPAWAGGLAVAVALVVVALSLWLPRRDVAPTAFARLVDVREPVMVSRGDGELQGSENLELRPGDFIHVANGAATVVLADRTRLELLARTELRIGDEPRGGDLVWSPGFSRSGARPGKAGTPNPELLLVTGRLAARVAKRPADRPLTIRTPLAVARVIGTEFTLDAAPRATRIEVSEGLVKMAHASVDSAVEVAGGEFAVAMPGSELLAGLQAPLPVERTSKSVPPPAADGDRDYTRHPFAANSPWNRRIGPGAAYADVQSPALDLARHGAVVLPASHDRPVVIARPGDPQGRIVGRYEEKMFATAPIPVSAFHDSPHGDWFNGTLIIAGRAVAYELFGARRRDGDIEVSLCVANDLRGAGVPPSACGQTFSGLPLVAGLMRAGELERGIPHALAAAALHAGLSRRGPDGQPFVWPARHMPIELKKIEMLGATGNVCYGTLLAIPRDVDISQLGVGNSGPAFKIARALQDYGAYVTHSYPAAPAQGDWVQPHLQFFAELPEGADFQKLAAEVSKLARHLKVVTNNEPATGK
ncbi:MAG: FecR domain-containing protein [Verrucomicrobia bacterium]|nr:FecR domain-containing protein [Verrucomicrobiota bacterium]